MQTTIRTVLSKNSDRLRALRSPTTAAIFVSHDDSNTPGSGLSVVKNGNN
ncbi:hypothetical protein [Undibacterium sp. WLX3042]